MRPRPIPLLSALAALVPLAPMAPMAPGAPEARWSPQDPPGTPGTEKARDDDGSRPLRRILHLAGGTTLRGVTRRSEDGAWEVRSGGGWRRLPPEAVVRAVPERAVRAELRARERVTPDDDPVARAGVGSWALGEGLLEEGLTTLETLLAAHPDLPAARAALATHAHRFDLPRVDPLAEDAQGASDELRRWASARSTTSREMAVLELARLRDREGLEEVLVRDLFAGTVQRRSFATLALRRLFPGHALRPLIHRAVLDSSEDVRTGAARALRTTGRVGVIVPVAKALDSTHPKVRLHAAQALGHMGYPSAVEPLITRLAALQSGSAGHTVPHSHIFVGRQFAFIQDFDVEVAQFQAVADPQINVLVEGEVLDVGVRSVRDAYFVSESRAIRTSLEQLTGERPGRTNRSWLGWWEENRARWGAVAQADAPTMERGR